MPKSIHKGNSLSRAKRIFLVNLGLCLCLAVCGLFLISDDIKGTEEVSSVASEEESKWTLPELANLKGQILALRERPETMPEYEVEWVRKLALNEIQRDPSFSEAAELEKAELSNELFKGYTERFYEYYDDTAAREFGYQYGIKFDPSINGMFPKLIILQLINNRSRLEAEFNIQDEAQWYIFCETSQKGFNEGYPVIREGVTIQTHWDTIKLFEQ